MKHEDELKGKAESAGAWDELEPELRESLDHFKASVHALSESMISRPRVAHAAVVRRTWRFAAGWALGCVLVAGGVSSGVYEHHRSVEMAKIAAARQAEQQKQLAEQRAREEEDLLAKVDSDVSREAPSALEPLATLMSDDETTSGEKQ